MHVIRINRCAPCTGHAAYQEAAVAAAEIRGNVTPDDGSLTNGSPSARRTATPGKPLGSA